MVGERRNTKTLTFSHSLEHSEGHTTVVWVWKEGRFISEVENVLLQKSDLNSKGQPQNGMILRNYFSTFWNKIEILLEQLTETNPTTLIYVSWGAGSHVNIWMLLNDGLSTKNINYCVPGWDWWERLVVDRITCETGRAVLFELNHFYSEGLNCLKWNLIWDILSLSS